MFGIRQKLALGFGALLAVLVAVGLVGRWNLQRFSGVLEQVFRENYDSVVYGQAMTNALDGLDREAQSPTTSPAARSAELISAFEASLAKEKRNVTLSGEGELAGRAEKLWAGEQGYRASWERVAAAGTPEARHALYRDELFPLYGSLRGTAQSIVEINVRNMGLQNAQVKGAARRAELTLYALVGAGVVLGVGVVYALGRSILTPLRAVTESAHEIERGNLDLIVPVDTHDEVGRLAETFNRMAGRLRELRRTDRAKLVRTQRTTSLALGSLPDAVAILSPEGRVELSNASAEKLFGLRAEQALAGSDATGLGDLFRRAATERRTIQAKGYDAAIQIFNGSERFFLPTAVPILDEEQNLTGVTLVLADVTNLRKLDEMKSGLLAVVSHELRTPLTSIRMATHLLLEERVGALTAKQQELLVAARDEAERLHEIIENLLDIGRIESGRALLEARRVSPEQLVRTSVDEAAAAYREKGVALATELADELPSVMADADRASHVFSNLLGNALKYTGAGGKVSVSAAREGQFVRFAVTDSGIGIPAESLPHVFERFFRAPNQPAGQGGVGLGLAIAKEIVEASGGQIRAERAPGSGSRFSFTLPAAPDGAAGPANLGPARKASDA